MRITRFLRYPIILVIIVKQAATIAPMRLFLWFCRKVSLPIFNINLLSISDLSSILSDKDDFMTNFKGSHYPKDVILYAVYWLCRKIYARFILIL
jgi:hypothetical protein